MVKFSSILKINIYVFIIPNFIHFFSAMHLINFIGYALTDKEIQLYQNDEFCQCLEVFNQWKGAQCF